MRVSRRGKQTEQEAGVHEPILTNIRAAPTYETFRINLPLVWETFEDITRELQTMRHNLVERITFQSDS